MTTVKQEVVIATTEEMKAEAIRRLKKIDVMPVVIESFEKGELMFSERQNRIFPAALMDVDVDKNLKSVIEEFNRNNIGMVYHAIKTYMVDGGPRYTLLIVSKYKDDWAADERNLNKNSAMAYVSWWEKEIGLVGIKQAMGGIVQTW